MDINDISNCLNLIEEALKSDIFKCEKYDIQKDKFINKLEYKNKKIKKIQEKSFQTENISNNDNISNDDNIINNDDVSYSQSETSSNTTNLSGNYSNIKPLTIGSDLFKISESNDVDSNSCYNMAFLYNNADNTEVDAKIITYRK